jgi:hypothetical protein
MPKQKLPPLADWQVRDERGNSSIIRATSLHVREGAVVLADTGGHLLFSAPVGTTVVRRLEPGETAQETPARHDGAPPSVLNLEAPPVAPDPQSPAAETVATPAQRRKRASGTRS